VRLEGVEQGERRRRGEDSGGSGAGGAEKLDSALDGGDINVDEHSGRAQAGGERQKRSGGGTTMAEGGEQGAGRERERYERKSPSVQHHLLLVLSCPEVSAVHTTVGALQHGALRSTLYWTAVLPVAEAWFELMGSPERGGAGSHWAGRQHDASVGSSPAEREESLQAAKRSGFAGGGEQVPTAVIQRECNAKRTITSEEISSNPTLHLKHLHRCNFDVDDDVGKLAKVYVEECSDCTLTINPHILSSFIEIWRSSRCLLRFAGAVRTVQMDMCHALQLAFDSDSSFGSLVHASCSSTVLHLGNSLRKRWYSDTALESSHFTGTVPVTDSDGPSEQQKMTRMLPNHDLVTEDVIRGNDEYPTTAGKAPNADDDPLQKIVSRKQQGNESFKTSDFSQGVAHYTAALQAANGADENDKLSSCLSIVYANRSACFLKLGEHSKALADAKSAIKHDQSNTKGHFRHGISLHALGRYNEAVPCFLRALEIDPNNKQAKEGLGMSRMMHERRGSVNR